eukprot:jgi/Botrbrau1/19743/Bobra.0423s0002.1
MQPYLLPRSLMQPYLLPRLRFNILLLPGQSSQLQSNQ